MKKFVISIVILIIFGGAVFVLGWLEFFVPVDKVGVMISKTGGVKNEVISAGNFSWSWERLIPTNSKIRTFSVVGETFSKTIKGSLPSASVYKNMLDGAPDFSYNFAVEIVMNIKTSALPEFVRSTGAEDQSNLDLYLERQADTIARSTVEYVLTESIEDIDFVIQASLTDSELIDGIEAHSRFPDLNIQSIHINNITLPDITMYNHAKNSYAAYQEATQLALESSFELQGFDAAQDYLELERLTKLGKVLAEFPQLIDYIAVSNGNYEIPSDIPLINELSQ